jgi:hypothetical protein
MKDFTKLTSTVYFNKYRVHKYTDQTNIYYQFEDYAPYFLGLIDCIKWGRAYQDAESQLAEAQKKIAELQAETSSHVLLRGLIWAEAV